MAKKEVSGKAKKTQVKHPAPKGEKQGRKHVKGEIIDADELERRGGFTGDETALLTIFLHKFEEGNVHIRYSKKLRDLAEFIYEKKLLYVPKHGGYKLMEASSIETKLCIIRKEERERKEEEERWAKKKEQKGR